MNRILRASIPPLCRWHPALRSTRPSFLLGGLDRVASDTPCTHVAQARRRCISGVGAAAGQDKHAVLASDTPTAANPNSRRAILLGTLDQRRLSTEDFFVPSGLPHKSLRVLAAPDIRASLAYTWQRGIDMPFPSDTQGFLYWHHESDAPALTGQVRLRITKSPHPATFPEAQDLQLPDGRIWNIPIYCIARRSNYAPLRAQLLSDKLVTEELLDTALSVSASYGTRTVHPNSESSFIWKFGQIFPVELEMTKASVWLLGRSRGQRLVLKSPFSLFQRSGTKEVFYAPFIGKALVQFERSTLPEHEGTRTVVLRISKIVELTKSETSGGVDGVPEPKEGGLVLKRTPNRKWIPWSVDVDQPRSEYHAQASRALAILFDNEEWQAGLASRRTGVRGNEPDRLITSTHL
ncbi:hypothetical protein OE88DRAFT_1656523 [Heliocybe sulcata]|uniref:Uncharacterized protein n=1 Tax=Heliocybe sulcata TaxID=5364 RepID=A0A5C3N5E1_9AGAM|nr:hypothetical protein OE88DRAFT_1656523 [Heliocybe sulcata]